jgi:L,D-transpeptidase YbiS
MNWLDLLAEQEEPQPAPRAPTTRRFPLRLALLAAVACALGFLVLLAWLRGGYAYGSLSTASATVSPVDAAPASARREAERLAAQLAGQAPREPYIVIDRTANRIYLWRGGKVDLTAVCSAGSGSVLVDAAGERRWVFDTPQGRFRVLKKIENPVWRKPDWAFVEEGKPVPERHSERFEYGVLGEYGLYFGDGYLIHGTLYERLLGRAVSHGCIRVGRDDLRQLYREARVGTSIYIF